MTRYMEVQQQVNSNLALSKRAPQDEDEIEFGEVASWLTLRRKLFFVAAGGPDPLLEYIQRFQAKRKEKSMVRPWELSSAAPAYRTEFAPPKEMEALPPKGQTLYMIVDGPDILFVQPGSKEIDTGTVAFVLRTIFTDTFVDQAQPFRLHFVERSPTRTVALQVVLRDRNQCREAEGLVRLRVDGLTRDACVLLSSLLRYHVLRTEAPQLVVDLVEV